MKILVYFFASYRETTGCSKIELETAQGTTVSDVLLKLRQLYPDLAPREVNIVASLNEEFVHSDQEVSEGDEIALIPPVSGGEK